MTVCGERGFSGRSRRSLFRSCAAALFWGALSWCGSARADDVDVCVTASDEGHVLRDKGRLRAAREHFLTCSAERCPAIVRRDCAAWLAAVTDALPSVVVRARDTAGHDLLEVRVTADTEPLVERLDGRALAVDPGWRTFRFSTKDAPDVTQTVLLREGERGRVLDVVLGEMGREGGALSNGSRRAAASTSTFSIPSATWVFAGFSLVGFGAAIGFGAAAKSAVDDMRQTCAPTCEPSRVDEARRDMIVANVALGVGAAALGTAAVLLLIRNVGRHETGASRASARGLEHAPSPRAEGSARFGMVAASNGVFAFAAW